MTLRPAPEWQTTDWLNTPEPLSLEKLRGRVVLLHAFQMLCPGCVARGIPQAQRVAAAFAGAPLTVVGLHRVRAPRGHAAPILTAFLHEYRVTFPVGVDALETTPHPQDHAGLRHAGDPHRCADRRAWLRAPAGVRGARRPLPYKHVWARDRSVSPAQRPRSASPKACHVSTTSARASGRCRKNASMAGMRAMAASSAGSEPAL